MKKLKLNLDEIKVESFETVLNTSRKGTVIGFGTEESDCFCSWDETCMYVCTNGCGYTANIGCSADCSIGLCTTSDGRDFCTQGCDAT